MLLNPTERSATILFLLPKLERKVLRELTKAIKLDSSLFYSIGRNMPVPAAYSFSQVLPPSNRFDLLTWSLANVPATPGLKWLKF